jgi:hypothetical protein
MTMPLAILLGIFAFIGLIVAFLGHLARRASAAPSMCSNDISPIGYAVFIVCGLLALATAASTI